MPIRVHTGADFFRAMPAVDEGVVASIRQILVAYGPRVPRSVLTTRERPPVAEGTAGQLARLCVTVRNLQSAVVVVSPVLTVLRRADGTTWAPDHALRAASRLLWPGERTTVDLAVVVADEVPAGTYDGAVRCLGTTGTVPLRVVVHEPAGR